MDTIHIQGGVALQGKVRIQGSKNASLPILASLLMTEGESVLSNVPRISDVDNMLRILSGMGSKIRILGNEIRIENRHHSKKNLPAELNKTAWS